MSIEALGTRSIIELDSLKQRYGTLSPPLQRILMRREPWPNRSYEL